MKQILIFILIILAVTCAAFGQTTHKRSDKATEEIKKYDRQWQVESYGSRDLKDFDRIVAEDFLITGSNGKILTKAEKRASVAADYTEPSTASPDYIFKIDNASHQVRILKNTAISTGFIIEKYIYKGNKNDSRVYFTCAYSKRKGKWQAVAAQYTRIKQQTS